MIQIHLIIWIGSQNKKHIGQAPVFLIFLLHSSCLLLNMLLLIKPLSCADNIWLGLMLHGRSLLYHPQVVECELLVVPASELPYEEHDPVETIATFFSYVMSAIGGNSAGPGNAVVNVYIKHEKKFAFVDMRNVEEVSNAMALDGITFEGRRSMS
ncbi:uncharacterized protein LOC131238636 [Magnolia sinica]|uniref:uncharacterized protein LOC131238636 n=1 Tax=Magnolia sinica TaxID=86752 RepID=UPI00265A571D|nr:uncharacterized protein LOC131238636 [Magnolia sinica]